MNRSLLASLAVLTVSFLSHSALAADSSDIPGLRAQVVQLSRASGDTVTLRVEFENVSDKDQMAPDMSKTTLDEPIQRKEYLVLGANGALCSGSYINVPAHGRVVLWAKFPAPPPAIPSISVTMNHFAPIDDVPFR